MELKVPNMSCNNCVAKIQIQMLTKGVDAKFNLDKRIITVKEADKNKAIAAINAAGYDVLK
ncbi:MAG TPA: heavy-metal-associated domain-containing protein [Acholeplasmataceae bacterium]|nr:heavy-metal-associated domain-containing protein [Acholeplasmataceae bacterium]